MTRRLCHRKQVLILAVSFCLISQILLADIPVEHVYAYATETELVVMRGDQRLASEKIIYNFRYGGMAVTLDGRYYALLTDKTDSNDNKAAETRELVVIDAKDAGSRRLGCAFCNSVVAVGGSRVLAYLDDDYGGLYRFDLASSEPPVRFSLKPGVINRLLAGSHGVALGANLGVSTWLDSERYYLVYEDGSLRLIGMRSPRYKYDEKGIYGRGIGRSAASAPADGNAWFAVSSGYGMRANGPCSYDGSISVFSSKDADDAILNMEPMRLPGITPGSNGSLLAYDLWWDYVGVLHAVIFRTACPQGVEIAQDSVSSEWEYRNGQWSEVSSEQLRTVRRLDEKTRIVVKLRSLSADNEPRTLYYDYNGRLKEIAKYCQEIKFGPFG